jgi:glutamate racemase
MGDGVTLVSSAEETAKDVLRVLSEAELLRAEAQEPEHVFTATGDPVSFSRLARRFLGPSLAATAPVDMRRRG